MGESDRLKQRENVEQSPSCPPHLPTEELGTDSTEENPVALVCSSSSCFIATQSAMTTQVRIDLISSASLIILR